jgi:peroxiredoxin
MRRERGTRVRRTATTLALVWALAVLAAGCGGANPGSGEGTGVQIGDQAADFRLATLDGDEIALSDFRGSVVLVNFWATWCGPCRSEMPAFQGAYEARAEDGLVVLAVNYQQKAEEVRPFVEELGLTFPVVLDPSLRVARLYQVRGLPSSMIVDPDGVVRVRHIGEMTPDMLQRYLLDYLP